MLVLETKRFLIKEAKLDDDAFFFELMNSPGWLEFIGDRGIKSKNDAVAYIQKNVQDNYSNLGFGLYKMILKEGLEPIGICGFLKRDYLDSPDIGFAILPEYEGKGYMLEAAKGVLQYGIIQLKLNPILAVTTVENNKSKALLIKLGLRETGSIQPNENSPRLLLYSNQQL